LKKSVEKNLSGFIQKLGDMMSSNLKDVNKPFLSGLEQAKKAVKSSQMAQVYEKRTLVLCFSLLFFFSSRCIFFPSGAF